MIRGALQPFGMSRNSSLNLAFRAGSTASSLLLAVLSLPDLIETMPLFRTSAPKFLHGASRSKLREKSLPVRQVSRSSISMSNRRLIGRDPFLESLRVAANCRVHVGRVLDIGSSTSGSE